MNVSVSDIQRLFGKVWVSISPHKIMATLPNVTKEEDCEVLVQFVGDDVNILSEIIRRSTSIEITHTDGKHASIIFIGQNQFDGVHIYSPTESQTTMDGYRKLLCDMDNFNPANDNIDLAKNIFSDDHPYNIRSAIKWNEYIQKTRQLSYMLPNFYYEESPPTNSIDVGYTVFTSPMDDDSNGCTTVIYGTIQDVLYELVGMSSSVEISFCCCDKYSTIELIFTV